MTEFLNLLRMGRVSGAQLVLALSPVDKMQIPTIRKFSNLSVFGVKDSSLTGVAFRGERFRASARAIFLTHSRDQIRQRHTNLLTGSMTPASGVVLTSSPPAATAFSIVLRVWSTGGHSPFIVSVSSFCAPSLRLAPALPGFLVSEKKI